MIPCKLVAAIAAVGLVGLGLVAARAGADKVAFPENYAKGVKWLVADKPQIKQIHVFYAMPETFEAARKDAPMPNGTVLVREEYDVQLDAQGNPVKDPDGHLVQARLRGYGVMEKRSGWGAEYPADVRNGEWEYQSFKADKTPNENAKLAACFGCHKPQVSDDFLYARDKLKSAAR